MKISVEGGRLLKQEKELKKALCRQRLTACVLTVSAGAVSGLIAFLIRSDVALFASLIGAAVGYGIVRGYRFLVKGNRDLVSEIYCVRNQRAPLLKYASSSESNSQESDDPKELTESTKRSQSFLNTGVECTSCGTQISPRQNVCQACGKLAVPWFNRALGFFIFLIVFNAVLQSLLPHPLVTLVAIIAAVLVTQSLIKIIQRLVKNLTYLRTLNRKVYLVSMLVLLVDIGLVSWGSIGATLAGFFLKFLIGLVLVVVLAILGLILVYFVVRGGKVVWWISTVIGVSYAYFLPVLIAGKLDGSFLALGFLFFFGSSVYIGMMWRTSNVRKHEMASIFYLVLAASIGIVLAIPTGNIEPVLMLVAYALYLVGAYAVSTRYWNHVPLGWSGTYISPWRQPR